MSGVFQPNVFQAGVFQMAETHSGTGTLSTSASLTGTGAMGGRGAGSVSAGVALLTGSGVKDANGTGTPLALVAILASTDNHSDAGAGSLGVTATLTASGAKASAGVGTVSTTASLSASATFTRAGSGTLGLVASLSGAGQAGTVESHSGTGAIVLAAVLLAAGWRTEFRPVSSGTGGGFTTPLRRIVRRRGAALPLPLLAAIGGSGHKGGRGSGEIADRVDLLAFGHGFEDDEWLLLGIEVAA